MRWHGRRVTVYAYGVPTDMRKGFDGLGALVSQRFGRDPLNGDVDLFLSRDRVRAKVLHFDGTGLCIYAKRLERGRFASLWREERGDPITLTVSELDLFLDGSARASPDQSPPRSRKSTPHYEEPGADGGARAPAWNSRRRATDLLDPDDLQQTRTQIFQRPVGAPAPSARRPQPGHGPREHPTLPIVGIRHALPADQRQCPACGGELTEMADQAETSDRITSIKLTYQVERHVRQKYRCACNGAVVTAPGPAQLMPGGRYAPEFAVGVAVAKYADHLPLERQVRMMAHEGLRVDSQTL